MDSLRTKRSTSAMPMVEPPSRSRKAMFPVASDPNAPHDIFLQLGLTQRQPSSRRKSNRFTSIHKSPKEMLSKRSGNVPYVKIRSFSLQAVLGQRGSRLISIQNREYDPDRWWESSEGVKETISEALAYCYARLFFVPAQESKSETK